MQFEKPGVTLGDVKALALVDVLAYTLAGNRTKTPGDTRSDVKAEELVETLRERLAEVKAQEVGETLMDVTTDSLVEALANTLAELEAKTVGDRLGDTRPRHWLTRLLTPNRGRGQDTRADTMAATLAGVKTERVGETLKRVKAERLVHTKADTLPKVEAEI